MEGKNIKAIFFFAVGVSRKKLYPTRRTGKNLWQLQFQAEKTLISASAEQHERKKVEIDSEIQ